MDIDPLSDTGAPRYAVESDDEDEYNPLSKPSEPVKHDLEIEIIGKDSTADHLIIAIGDAGRVWARGAKLGEQLGAIAVNKKQAGMLFRPSWTDALVVVSEVFIKLPIYAMHPYAEFVLDHIKPTQVLLLDIYSLPGYIDSYYIPFHQAPVRYLSTPATPAPTPGIQLFAPPNLIQSTSASFLSLVGLKAINSDARATAFLLPSAQLPTRPPNELLSDPEKVADKTNIWSPELVQQAHSAITENLGGKATEWENKGEQVTAPTGSSRTAVEGNMYI